MAKLIEADALKVAIRDDANIDGRNYARVKRHINEAEAVEVVRCKDCKKATKSKTRLDLVWCGKFGNIMLGCGFCSCGERKTNG